MRVGHLNCDVIILGGGIVGCATALLVRKHLPELRVGLIDQGQLDALNEDSVCGRRFDASCFWDQALRVSALGLSSRIIFQSLGLWEAISRSSLTPYHDMALRDADGTGQARIDAQSSGQSVLGYIVENNAMLMHLQRACQKDPLIKLVAGQRVTSIVPARDDQPNIIYTVDTHAEQQSCFRAPLVVCAQGRQSVVREQLAFPVLRRPYGQQALVCQVKLTRPHLWTAWQDFLDTGPLAFLPLTARPAFDPADEVLWPSVADSERFCSIVWSLDDHQAQSLLALPDQVLRTRMCQELSRLAPSALGAVEQCSMVRAFPLSGFMAKRLHCPGLALVGDCAHGYHPMAGQGLNIGLLDAAVLVDELEKSAAKYRNYYHIAGLRRYERQRKPHQSAVFEVTSLLHKLYRSDSSLLRLGRNFGLNLLDKAQPLKQIMVKVANAHNRYLPERYQLSPQLMPF